MGTRDEYYEQRAFWFKYLVKYQQYFRSQIYDLYKQQFPPKRSEKILDLGVSDVDMNYFHKLYPYKANITAAGLARKNRLIENKFPQIKYVQVSKVFPYKFRDNEFDIVHSSAVIEHVGDRNHQLKFLKECYRMGRKGMISTPNRWYPIELHTYLPLVHWLPTKVYRKIFLLLGLRVYSREKDLNLLDRKNLEKLAKKARIKNYWIVRKRTLLFVSNLLLCWIK